MTTLVKLHFECEIILIVKNRDSQWLIQGAAPLQLTRNYYYVGSSLAPLNPTSGTSQEWGDLFVIDSIVKNAVISSNLFVK